MSAPTHRAYTVIKREGKDDYWLNLGVAFPHEDGEGFNLLLQACRSTANWFSGPTRRNQKSRRRSSRASSRSRTVACATQLKEPSATPGAPLLVSSTTSRAIPVRLC